MGVMMSGRHTGQDSGKGAATSPFFGVPGISGELGGDLLDLEPLLKVTWLFDSLKKYFHYEVRGLERIPATGPALLVMNHGLLVVDAVLLGLEAWRRNGRVIRFLGAHFLFQVPLLRKLFRTAGVVDGNPMSADDLVKRGDLVGVMPGGVPEACRPSTERYQLRWGERTGFVSLALRHQIPIIPAFCIGNDDLYHVFSDGRSTKEALGLRGFQLPLFLGLGPLPLPAKMTHYIGEPIVFDEGPKAAEDKEVLLRLQQRVKGAMEELKLRGLEDRGDDVFDLWPTRSPAAQEPAARETAVQDKIVEDTVIVDTDKNDRQKSVSLDGAKSSKQ